MSIIRLHEIDKIIKEASKHNYVLMGESTHGTKEYFEKRLFLTKNLVLHHNFNIVLFETEWSIGYEINQYIHGEKNVKPKELLLKLSAHYPKWMLYNKYILELIIFMKKWNNDHDAHDQKIYFYGIDCQNLEIAKKNVCNKPHINCEIVKSIINNHDKMHKANSYWDMRDKFWLYIMETIKKYHDSKFILWAHNSHIGNISANKNNRNSVNIGHLLENIYNIYNIGFLTYNGSVTASKSWNMPGHEIKLNDAIRSSYEYIFHTICKKNRLKGIIYLCNKNIKNEYYNLRYIGVVYNKNNEMNSHYQLTNINKEYDVVIFINTTHALKYI